jgi:molecular chaperone HtpG
MAANKSETINFQTEVKQLLHLVINSLYSNKEIFLRELISNASDALDKLRYLALSNGSLYEQDSDLKITVTVDKENKTITVKDNGVGMNKEDIINNLGTIAKSGTKEFLSQLSGNDAKDSHLIGQFGVGFYSAFIVADKVTVRTRKAGEPVENAVKWSSTGEGAYEIEPIHYQERGTEITLHIKEEEGEEFLNDWRLKNIIHKYSDHICWPIMMEKAPEPSEEEDKKSEEKTEKEFETVNKATALWTLPKKDISNEEYKALYKHISHDFEDPLLWLHNHVEGKFNYITLFYIPSKAPFDLWQPEAKHGLKLYAKRVFIMDEAEQFLPRYLRFIKGIVDSSDLPLNVSREILQDNKLINTIRTASVKKVLSALERCAEDDKEKYQTFWDNFGQVMKEGPIEDFSNRERIASLLRFASTNQDSDKQTVSLDDYIERMQEGQDKIYYVTASSYLAAKNSPHLEYFRKKNIEVLLLSDRVDEWLVTHLSEYKEKKLQSISKGNLEELNQEEAEETQQDKAKFESVTKHMQELLGDKVKEVRLSNRLTDSPACVVADENDIGLEMQRILQAAGQAAPESKPILELNPENQLVAGLLDETDDQVFADWTQHLFEQAVLAEGGELDNPGEFVSRMNRLLLNQH